MGRMRQLGVALAAHEDGVGPLWALSAPSLHGHRLGQQQPACCSPKNEEAKRPDFVLDSLHIHIPSCGSSSV